MLEGDDFDRWISWILFEEHDAVDRLINGIDQLTSGFRVFRAWLMNRFDY